MDLGREGCNRGPPVPTGAAGRPDLDGFRESLQADLDPERTNDDVVGRTLDRPRCAPAVARPAASALRLSAVAVRDASRRTTGSTRARGRGARTGPARGVFRHPSTEPAEQHLAPAVVAVEDVPLEPPSRPLRELGHLAGGSRSWRRRSAPPRHVPVWLAKPLIRDAGVWLMTRAPGASNAKAKAELGWTRRYALGFREGLGADIALGA
jgi:hypothetical protein